MACNDQLQLLRVDAYHYGAAFLTDKDDVWDYLASVAVANDATVPEGLMTYEIPAGDYILVESTLEAMHKNPLGKNSKVIGEVVREPAGKVIMETEVGGHRIIDMLVGEQFPRIC